MIGVEKIGEIRRAYFEQHRSIKEIVRTLSVSRATVRKVVRGHQTEFKYERGVQPAPKLGAWIEVLTEILEQEAKLPKRERRSTQRLGKGVRWGGTRLACPAWRAAYCSRCARHSGCDAPRTTAHCRTLRRRIFRHPNQGPHRLALRRRYYC